MQGDTQVRRDTEGYRWELLQGHGAQDIVEHL